MLSVVIATHNSERSLLPTLAALVQGAAAGIVREVIVADAGSRDATAAIADGAGCRLLLPALGAKPDASQGLVIAKARYAALGGHRDVEEPERDLRRRLRRRHLMLLRTGAIVAGSDKILD